MKKVRPINLLPDFFLNKTIRMNKNPLLILLVSLSVLMMSCIQEEPLNPEADILTFIYPEVEMRITPEIRNDYIIVYPNSGVDITTLTYTITVSTGAIYKEIKRTADEQITDTVFYIQVTAKDHKHTKQYAVIQRKELANMFTFDEWVTPEANYLYKNPKDNNLLWSSSNNGASMFLSGKPAGEYPVRQTIGRNGTGSAASIVTMKGPGNMLVLYIPCLSGSLFLGNFKLNISDPLLSTRFGVPFDNGRPEKLIGYYKYIEGEGPYIRLESKNKPIEEPGRKDSCAIYAVLFEIDPSLEFLDGHTISSSPNVVARAEISKEESAPTSDTDFHYFEANFVYNEDKPFDWDKLKNNQYKLTVVFASAMRGDYYEGRLGNTLIVDDVSVVYQLNNE
jgi:hypothetical protein